MMKKIVSESLNESLKDELISTILRVIYNDDKSYMQYLQSLPEEVLDKILGDYYFQLNRIHRQ